MVKLLKTSPAKPTVDCSPATTKHAQSALAAVFTAVDKSQLGTVFWCGTPSVSTAAAWCHLLLRLGAVARHAFMMLVAGLVEFKKMHGQDGYYLCNLTSKKDAWDKFANAHMLGEFVEWRDSSAIRGREKEEPPKRKGDVREYSMHWLCSSRPK